MATPLPALVPVAQLSAGDTAWMISATTLVLLMSLPGLALFYAGMVRRKNVLGTLAQVLAIAALVSLLWFAIGYSLAFGPGDGWIGDWRHPWMASLRVDKPQGLASVHPLMPSVPEAVFAMFQLSFAVITPALIVGAVAERMRFAALLWFSALWSLGVYAPLAHWVWSPEGWLAQRGALDFAGGTVVHLNAGVAGLVAAWWLGPRQGWGREALTPSHLGQTMTGAALLWVGWIGFNAGSAGAADARAAMAMLATQLAGAAGALGWMLAEWTLRRTPTLLGLCSGVVAGLVAVTPASGFVGPGNAVLIGAVAGLAGLWGATGLKRLLGVDDSLDVFGVHGIGGLVGALLTGVLAEPLVGGVSGSLAAQATAAGATLLYSGVATAFLLWLVDALVGLRLTPDQERLGLDLAQHGERID
ncbi:ammonium transporter [Ideonella alba]|uniref:Ammonium transporter n=1 Tax=Ideonella alba TaxID=2824118 RepID=A0A940YA55_9BURK|nr:ammonium transporter [Ideonella alba]MBQ0932814.1 ammonium transporter [Ideonella alba]